MNSGNLRSEALFALIRRILQIEKRNVFLGVNKETFNKSSFPASRSNLCSVIECGHITGIDHSDGLNHTLMGQKMMLSL